jgi:hypothetical protein
MTEPISVTVSSGVAISAKSTSRNPGDHAAVFNLAADGGTNNAGLNVVSANTASSACEASGHQTAAAVTCWSAQRVRRIGQMRCDKFEKRDRRAPRRLHRPNSRRAVDCWSHGAGRLPGERRSDQIPVPTSRFVATSPSRYDAAGRQGCLFGAVLGRASAAV